jgi:glycosyltransferase involved in cell wall biosynthesis
LSCKRFTRNRPPHAHVCPHRPRYPFSDNAASPWRARFARYVSYPLQVRAIRSDLNHIIDQGYAHLLCTLPPKKTVVTVHDLIPLAAHRGKIPAPQRHRPFLSELSARFLRGAGSLIAVSEHTKLDLVELCNIPPDLIHVVPLGVSSEFQKLGDTKVALREKLGLDSRESFLILITGTHFYKNHETSLAVLQRLRRRAKRDYKIVWLGNCRAINDPRVINSGLASAVVGIEPRSIRQVVEVYNAVDCLLFPSLYEGFGWPPLEAMACGTPVICSSAASLPEVVGDAALTTPPDDVEGFVEYVRALAQCESQRALLVKRGIERASLFSWERHARAVWSIYRQLL